MYMSFCLFSIRNFLMNHYLWCEVQNVFQGFLKKRYIFFFCYLWWIVQTINSFNVLFIDIFFICDIISIVYVNQLTQTLKKLYICEHVLFVIFHFIFFVLHLRYIFRFHTVFIPRRFGGVSIVFWGLFLIRLDYTLLIRCILVFFHWKWL